MDELNGSPPPVESPLSPEILSEPSRRDIFFDADGMRVIWRLLIFFAIVAALFGCLDEAVKLLHHGRMPPRIFSLRGLLLGETVSFGVFLLASSVMARIEKRSLADYGLPWKLAFQWRFWQGIVIGFASITLLLMAMRAAGAFQFGSIALHGSELWKYAVLWGITFLLVGLFEEFAFRGYALFTLSTRIGFWPAALLLSMLFGFVHTSNSGETSLGAFSAGFIGFVFCVMLRRSGNLWLPIGFHAAWDWGETFFYGVPDSGQVARRHLLNSSLAGPAWLSGGTVGPEASWLCLILVFLLGVFVVAFVRPTKPVNVSFPLAASTPTDASN